MFILKSYCFRFMTAAALLFFASCDADKPHTETATLPATPEIMSSKVEIRQVNGQYNFYINDTLFEVKGAGLGNRSHKYISDLAAAGATAFRTWEPMPPLRNSTRQPNTTSK